MSARLHIVQPGPQTTVQDLGRHGFQAYGVPVCGALDPVALRLANALVGNGPDAAALELRLAGPSFEVLDGPVRIAVAGASVSLDVALGETTESYEAWRAIDVPAGATVRLGALRGSGGAVLAVSGGIDVPAVMRSRATDLKGRFGGHHGRALGVGDHLPIGEANVPLGACPELPNPPKAPEKIVLRVVLGPQAEAFTEAAIGAFLGTPYRASREADRMGMRLDGKALAFVKSADIVSDGIANGSIQVPGSGLPIVLLSDHQTIGGYAKIATVISADLPLAGRLLPGAEIRFRAVSVTEAEDARRALETEIARLITTLSPVRDVARIDETALYRENLISGVVTALETL